ncbi:hypothetical protein D3C84_732910 [compost metagenome]
MLSSCSSGCPALTISPSATSSFSRIPPSRLWMTCSRPWGTTRPSPRVTSSSSARPAQTMKITMHERLSQRIGRAARCLLASWGSPSSNLNACSPSLDLDIVTPRTPALVYPQRFLRQGHPLPPCPRSEPLLAPPGSTLFFCAWK